MKKLFIQAGIIIISSLILLSSCTKESQTPPVISPKPGPGNNPGAVVPDAGISYLTLTNWTSIPNTGVYSCIINTPSAPTGVSSSPQINVYVLQSGNAINVDAPADINGGRIWTTIDARYINFVYRTASGYPPAALSIKIEIK